MVKRRLEWLVFHQQTLFGRKCVVRFLQRFFKPLFALTDVGGPGIIRAVGKPHGNIAALQQAPNFDAVLRMIERAFANRWIRIAERSEFVFLVLKQVWIDGTWLNPVAI